MKNIIKTICLTGGGTAGHVMPNLALANELIKNYNLIYIGSKNGMEKNIIKQNSTIPFFGIDTGKLKRYHALSNFTMPFHVIAGINEAKKILKNNNVDLVFSKGGYVAVPVVIAAHFLKIPVISHEADMTPGLANKICTPFSKKVCTSFEKTLDYLPKNKGVYTGLPIRKDISMGDVSKGEAFCNFKDNSKKNIFFIGGSSGSVFLNKLVRKNLDKLCEKYNIIHMCGKNHIDNNIKNDSYRQYEFIKDELKDVFAMSDLIISRAGANIIYEILSLGKLNILIPLSLKASRGDQILNANAMKNAGVSYVLMEDEIKHDEDALNKAIAHIIKHKSDYKDALAHWKKFDSTKEVIKVIEQELT